MKITGNKPPAMLPARAVFQTHDLARSAELFGVPLLPTPTNFFSELARRVLMVQRVLVAMQLKQVPQQALETAVWRFMWAIHCDPHERDPANNVHVSDEFIVRTLVDAGLQQPQAVEILQLVTHDDATKKALESNTKEAVEAGAYGSPTMLVTPGTPSKFFKPGDAPLFFFGSDRFEQMALVLGLPYEGANPTKAVASARL